MLNKRQLTALSGFSFRIAEILIAGGVVYGVMQPVRQWGLIVIAFATVPGWILVGILLLWNAE